MSCKVKLSVTTEFLGPARSYFLVVGNIEQLFRGKGNKSH